MLILMKILNRQELATQAKCICVQGIPPLEFMFKGDRVSLSFVEAVIQPPAIAKGGISRDVRVFPAECRGRRCTYKGKLVVSLRVKYE